MTIPTSEIVSKASEVAIKIIEHPKVASSLTALAGAGKWWVDWGSWIADALYSVFSIVLVLFFIHAQYRKYKKDKQEECSLSRK